MTRGAGRRGLAMLVAAAAVAGLSAAPASASSDVVSAARLRDLVKRGPVTRTGIQVIGTLDFRGLGVVRPFACRSCTIYGGVRASGVVFGGALDLSGTLVRGPVDFQEATFRGPALFGTPPAQRTQLTLFSRRADFSLARFDQLATFERASFKRGANFTLARFSGSAIFAGIDVASGAAFERVSLGGPADFLQARFNAGADFARAGFGERVNFSQSLYRNATADFSDARFDGDADFRGAFFIGGRGSSPYSANFDGATFAGDLDLASATFAAGAPAAFQSTTSAGTISLADATLPPAPLLVMTDMAARNLFVAVPDVLRSVQADDQRHVLALLETTAQARGDLGVANDALYAKRVLVSRDYWLPTRLLDVAFYRWVAGYLVRPLRPLAALALLAAIVTFVRVFLAQGLKTETRRAERRSRAFRSYVHHYLDTLSLVARGSDSSGRRLEVLAYRILLVCAVIGLANSNPTLREMIDALH